MLDTEESLLHRVFGTITIDEFFAEFWEQKPFHVSRNKGDHFTRYIDVDAVESLISNTVLHFPGVQLSGGAANLIPEHYLDTNERIVPTRLLQAHADGATIVMSKAHELHAPLAHLKRTMQSALELECQTNVYLSPAGKSGFNPHYDAHDVLILQVDGCKSFRFYGDGPYLPFSSERFEAGRDLPGRESRTVRLEPGDTLYIPRGMMHDAIADGDRSSLHITLGVYAVTWLDVLQKLLNQKTSEQQQLRQSIPRVHWLGAGDVKLLATEAQALMSELTPSHIQRAVHALRDEVALGSTPNTDKLLGRITQSDSVTSNSAIQLLPGRVISSSRVSDTLIVRCHGQILEFHEPFASGVEFLLDKRKTTVREWSGLTAEQQQALATQLMQENLVELG